MPDRKTSELSFESENKAESRLWEQLGQVPAEEPSSRLRQRFYHELERAARPHWTVRLRDLLGFRENMGWLTAAACLLIGAGTAQLVGGSGGDAARLAALEENVSMLNRSLILDRLDNRAPGKRLRGVIDAGSVVQDDPEIAQALLLRATEDRVHSVRTAAIEALGPQVTQPEVGEQLMQMLTEAESPLLQLALIDLVLRHGNAQQLRQLLQLAEDGVLYPDLVQHVRTSLRGDVV